MSNSCYNPIIYGVFSVSCETAPSGDGLGRVAGAAGAIFPRRRQKQKERVPIYLQEKFRREFKARVPCLRRLMGDGGGAGDSLDPGAVGGVGGAAVGANGATLAGATTIAAPANSSVTGSEGAM